MKEVRVNDVTIEELHDEIYLGSKLWTDGDWKVDF